MELENFTQWEYLIVVCRAYLASNRQEFVVQSVNGKEPEQTREVEVGLFSSKTEKRNPLLEEYLHEQGKSGWEVCGSSAFTERMGAVGDNFYLHVILKRPARY